MGPSRLIRVDEEMHRLAQSDWFPKVQRSAVQCRKGKGIDPRLLSINPSKFQPGGRIEQNNGGVGCSEDYYSQKQYK